MTEHNYRVTRPDGHTFHAKIVDVGDGVAGVVSNQGGTWARESLLTPADLIMPEQEFNEWDIRPAVELAKADVIDEARDERGRWTSGSGATHVLGDPGGSYWVTGAGKDEKVGAWRPFLNTEPRTFNNDPSSWKTPKEADEGLYGRHGLGIVKSQDVNLDRNHTPVSDRVLVERARLVDATLTDLKTRFPGLGRLHEAGYAQPVDLYHNAKVELVNGRLARQSNEPGKGGALAYFDDHYGITIASSLPSGVGRLKMGDWTVGGSKFQGVFTHELGHAIQDGFSRTVRRAGGFGIVEDSTYNRFAVAKLYNQAVNPNFSGDSKLGRQIGQARVGKQLSMYGATNAKEWFAESFAAYVHPDYASSKKKINPTLEALFDRVLR